ncbi:MAG: hypothetical protein ABIW84_01710 [Ilumatobacteraceae bacterium]
MTDINITQFDGLFQVPNCAITPSGFGQTTCNTGSAGLKFFADTLKYYPCADTMKDGAVTVTGACQVTKTYDYKLGNGSGPGTATGLVRAPQTGCASFHIEMVPQDASNPADLFFLDLYPYTPGSGSRVWDFESIVLDAHSYNHTNVDTWVATATWTAVWGTYWNGTQYSPPLKRLTMQKTGTLRSTSYCNSPGGSASQWTFEATGVGTVTNY